MDQESGRDFFISYTAVNEAWARWIAVELERAGYTTVVQAFDFRPSADFVHQMQQATTSARRAATLTQRHARNGDLAPRGQSLADGGQPPRGDGVVGQVRVNDYAASL